ncbi:LemA family protein [Methylocystis parvus]|uniref:LemA family protein n=1 Tax=Methylocystis parvus TaxID=134 RepID=A0A6B8LYD4_9HYPH|nr:LemA family protein [Methylocystis parvus]QGM96474.1 LemA family protein [Methylocystis parvus]WBJ99675.1 LemA family protein [Methylocystis parvus OBBP]
MSFFWILATCLGAVAALCWMTYNRLMALDSRCEQAMADIDVQLKQRHALLPNLLETVRAFTQHERDAIEVVAKARAAAVRATTPQAQLLAETALGDGIRQLLTIAESYPDLKASQHFRELRIEIADVENKLAASRRYLNATVNEFNATLRQFPANVLAGQFHLARRPFYDIGVERVLLDDAPVLKM